MKKWLHQLIMALVMGMVVPGLFLWLGSALMEIQGSPLEIDTVEPTLHRENTADIEILVRSEEEVTTCLLEAYLVGVVLAEMPASFEMEALKAQAVVARTYTMRAHTTLGKHGDGSVCTDYACCQAYIAPDAYLQQGGTRDSLDKIQAAVSDTAGLVLTYDDELIEATYFSCSGGSTEDALAVWGTDYPYLQATPSPGEEEAAHYTDTVIFTPQQFRQALGRSLSGSPSDWFGSVTYTEGGGVDTMEIGGQAYKGTELRQLLSLRSTAFTVSAGEEIIITTKGFGHRVGMSQYGADAMAVDGKSFADILAYYYRGTALNTLEAVDY